MSRKTSSMRPHTSVRAPERPLLLDGPGLRDRFQAVRRATEALCATLVAEDCIPQSMPDASPVKWHLAHTTWFFETLVLRPAGFDPGHVPGQYAYLFNSYYNALGERHPRSERGLLTRPTVAEVARYRESVDLAILGWLDQADDRALEQFGPVLELGLHHEQQHQELILTDLKHLFSRNPLRPVFREQEPTSEIKLPPLGWVDHGAGLYAIGHDGPGFAFDNERPRHQVYLETFALADRLATNGEYLAFIADGGYARPEFWLSDGWNARNVHDWNAPMYWEPAAGGAWRLFTLAGMRDLIDSEPVCHVSFYEADAFARWAGARLPTEAEWEIAATERAAVSGGSNLVEHGRFHPAPLNPGHDETPAQLYGDVWEWTASPYTPYPGFQPLAGALGEYNGKFMCNQMVLRGGSCATPCSHIRPTYRNFFPPEARWQFSGIRLAR